MSESCGSSTTLSVSKVRKACLARVAEIRKAREPARLDAIRRYKFGFGPTIWDAILCRRYERSDAEALAAAKDDDLCVAISLITGRGWEVVACNLLHLCDASETDTINVSAEDFRGIRKFYNKKVYIVGEVE